MADTFPSSTRKLAVSLPADRINVCVGADTYSIILPGSDTDEKFSFIDMLIPPGGGPMPHAHECEETFYVLEGEVAVFSTMSAQPQPQHQRSTSPAGPHTVFGI